LWFGGRGHRHPEEHNRRGPGPYQPGSSRGARCSNKGTLVATRMSELAGRALLGLGVLLSAAVLLVAYQLYALRQSLEHAVLLCFALSSTYGAVCLLIGGVLPLRTLYDRPDLLEMMHRSRYLIFDCAALPMLLWLLAVLLHRQRGDFGLGGSAGLLDSPWRLWTLALLATVHLLLAGLAASDCVKYPFTMENCLGVVYWRPARFTHKMKYPWFCTIRALWVFAALRCLVQRRAWLLIAVAPFHAAYYGHMSPWHYWPSEIFMQPFATAILGSVLLLSLDVSVQCDMRMGLSGCIVAVPGGAMPLFGAPTGLRF